MLERRQTLKANHLYDLAYYTTKLYTFGNLFTSYS